MSKENRSVEESETAEEKQPLVAGNGKFKSVEDLQRSYAELEKKLGEQGNELGSLRKALAKTTSKEQDFNSLGDKLYEEPASVLKQIVSDLKSEIIHDLEVRDQNKAFWDDFFSQNPDLATNKARRQAIEQSAETFLWGELENKSEKEQFSTLGSYWRNVFGQESIRDSDSASEVATETASNVSDRSNAKVDEERPANLFEALNKRKL